MLPLVFFFNQKSKAFWTGIGQLTIAIAGLLPLLAFLTIPKVEQDQMHKEEKVKEVEDNLAEQEQVVSGQAAVFLAEEEVEEEGEGEEKGKKQGMVRGGRRERRERLRSLSNSHRLLIPYHIGERKFI